MRVGFGYDVHPFVSGRPLVLGGIKIPYLFGLKGHSDADVLTHAICDALLGAIAEGDIGKHFPDSDPTWKDASSVEMLRYVSELADAGGFEVKWIDSVVIAERPKLAPHIESMKEALSRAHILPGVINIKAKTDEGMGFIGREEGIAAYAVCLLGKRGI